MSNIYTSKESLLIRWQSLRLYNIVILGAFLFFYSLGTLQSYSFFTSKAVFNMPIILPLGAIFLSAYLIHCLINKKDQQSTRLIPVISIFTTLFITINSHFETETSQNSFLYFTLLLPLFYAYILSYNIQLLLINNVIVIISYSFTAIIGETSSLVFIFNLVFLCSLCFLTLYAHIKNNNYYFKENPSNAAREPTLDTQNSIYLQSIIHDIRQPLSSLLLYSHLLKEKSTDPQQKMLIENLSGSSTQLDHWLSSLLELATLNTKNQKTNIKNIPLETCLSSVIEKYQAQAHAQGMILKIHFSKIALHTDSKLLSEIIDSLLNNALLHGSQKKGETVLISARQQQETVNIQVWNRGERIHDEQLSSLFDELYYSKNPNHNKAKGIGLGLALAQRKALLLNTNIIAKTSDHGSCFSIRIAKGIQVEETVSNTFLQQESNQKVLLVDDDTGILTALSMLLKIWGYSVKCAESSKQAITLLEAEQFSLIISDFRLPGDKTGIDLIKLAQQTRATPAVLLTGDVEPEKTQDGEIRNYKVLHKPIKPATLRLLLRQLLKASRTE